MLARCGKEGRRKDKVYLYPAEDIIFLLDLHEHRHRHSLSSSYPERRRH